MSWRRAQLWLMPRVPRPTEETVSSVLAVLSANEAWRPSHWGPSLQQRRPFDEADLRSWLPMTRDADGREEELIVRRMSEPPYYLLRWTLTARVTRGTFQLSLLPDAAPSALERFFAVADDLAVVLGTLYGGVQLADWEGDPKVLAGPSGIHGQEVGRPGLEDVFPRTYLSAELAARVSLEATALSTALLRFDARPSPWGERPEILREGMERLRAGLITAGLTRTSNGMQREP